VKSQARSGGANHSRTPMMKAVRLDEADCRMRRRGEDRPLVVAERASDTFVWRAPLIIQAKSCGEARADWNRATRTLTLCYELAQEFASLYASYGTVRLVSRRQERESSISPGTAAPSRAF
jgi:hypothetical protein